MSIVVGGGSGFIGTSICKLLRKNGYNVIVISRNPVKIVDFTAMSWNDLAGSGLPDCKAVINVAGQNILIPTKRWTDVFKEDVWSSRVHTTKSLAEAIRNTKKPPEVFITTSGVAFYKPSKTEEYTEDSHGGDSDFFSKLCLEWEQAANLPNELKVRQVTIRTGVVLGRQGGMIQQAFWPFYLGAGGRIGKGDQYLPWIHINDIAGLHLYAVENEKVSGILNGVAPEIITNKDFTKAFAKALWRPAVFPVPNLAMKAIFGSERASIVTEGQKVLPKRTLELGYQYQFPDIKSACKQFSKLIYIEGLDK